MGKILDQYSSLHSCFNSVHKIMFPVFKKQNIRPHPYFLQLSHTPLRATRPTLPYNCTHHADTDTEMIQYTIDYIIFINLYFKN